MSRRFTKNHSKKSLMLIIVLVLFLIIGMGYSTLGTTLNLEGLLVVSKYQDPTKLYLYNVLKNEAESNGLAKEYTGDHKDSFVTTGHKKIYHWYVSNASDGAAIKDKNNVIFANHCWQMIRTTDVGGVKLVYNGEAENNQCLDTRGNHVGAGSRERQTLGSSYWYGTKYTYDSSTQLFQLSGDLEQATWNSTTTSYLMGKYTCKSLSAEGTCSTIYLVDSPAESYYASSNAYVIPISISSHYSQFGALEYNRSVSGVSTGVLAGVGYMYNTTYPHYTKDFTERDSIVSISSFFSSMWVADSVTWNGYRYSLDNPYQVSDPSEYPNLVGKYTFRESSQSYTGTGVQYITNVNDSTYYCIYLYSGEDFDDVNYVYTYGDSYTDNGDGTYTINDPLSFERKDWLSSNSNADDKYVCINAVDNSCSELRYMTSGGSSMEYLKVYDAIKYANGFTYENGVYHLNDDYVILWNPTDQNNIESLKQRHYTCWNDTGECTTISYFYTYYTSSPTQKYVNLTGGQSIDDFKYEALYADNVNTYDSTIKRVVDAWYSVYLTDYDDYIDDTIFCNDRTQSNESSNGWNPNGSGFSEINFYGSSGLSCLLETDQFSVSNPKAKLKYKVGLMTYPELSLLHSSAAISTEKYWWTMTPLSFDSDGNNYVWNVYSNGVLFDSYVDRVSWTGGIRPAISLKSGVQYLSGDGSMANPYIVDTN